MSSFPGTKQELLRAKYTQTSANAICKGCQAPIEWWKTTSGKSIPMNPMADDYAVATAHWSTCPNAKDFKGTDAAAAVPEKQNSLPASMAEDARRLRQKHNARVVVVIDDFGTAAYWRNGIPAEDLRHDLISAGNFVRNEIAKKEGTPA
jgi:hypothetical protein